MRDVATACRRLLVALFAGLLLALPGLAWAQEIAIVPESAVDDLVVPRSLITVALRITNNSNADGNFDAVLALPPGWRTVTPDGAFALARGASTIRLLSIFVPEAATAGEHILSYSLRNRAAPAIGGAYAVRINVAPAVKLALTLLDIPDMVVAGEPYSGTFLLKNSGNAPVTVDYKAQSSRGFPMDLAPGAMTLAPGTSHTFTIRVTSSAVTALERDWLVVTASVGGGTVPATVRATGVVQLIPQVTGAERRYETVPASAALRYVSADDKGRRRSTVQAEVAGGGKLDGGGDRYVDFLLRGPGAGTTSGFGQLAEYRVAYRDPRWALGLGDLNYGLSMLTEAGSYGRGASLAYQGESLSLSAYTMRDRYARVDRVILPAGGPIADAVEQLTELTAPLARTVLAEQALGVKYASAVGLLGVHLLHKTDYRCPTGADIASIGDQVGSLTGFAAEVEVAQSSCDGTAGNAYRVALADRRYRLTWRASITHADAQYAGYNPDQALAVFQAEYPLTAALSVHAAWREQKTNLGLDARRAALDEHQGSAGFGYRFANGAQVDIDYLAGVTADLRAQPDYDASRQAVRASAYHRYRGLGLYASASIGHTDDRVRKDRFPTRQLLASAFWTASAQLSIGANLYYIDNAYSTRKEEPQTSIGSTLRYAFSEATTLDANLQQSRAGVGGSAGNLTLVHRLDNGNVMTLAVRQLRVGATRQGDLMLSYAMPLSVPVARRRDVASVNGRVLDQETGRGMGGKVLRLGGILAVSAADGAFSFPSIPVGTYYLSLDDMQGAGGTIPVEAMPMEVQVREGDAARLNIALVQAATLAGTVALSVPADAPGAGLLRNMLVTFRKGAVTFNRLTDEAGAFRLGSIAPGEWAVSVAPSTVPDGYALEQEQFTVMLAPAGQSVLAFKLAVRVRTIKMQELTPVGR